MNLLLPPKLLALALVYLKGISAPTNCAWLVWNIPIVPPPVVRTCYAMCWVGTQTDDEARIRDYVIQHVSPSLLYLPKEDRRLVCILPAHPRWGKTKPGNREATADE